MADFPFRFGPGPCCCPTGCGCSEQTKCFPLGDRLVATSISSSSTGGCDALNGIVKYFVWNGGWWEPESDGYEEADGYHPCLSLFPGATKYAKLECDGSVYCPEDPGDDPCFDYKLVMNFPQCGGTDPISVNGICPAECTCDPFYLRFNGLIMNGGPQGPFSGGIYTFLCHCDELASCWPASITAPDVPANYVYTMDWVFTREYSCCCPNLDKTTAPELLATVDSDPGEGPCEGTMEGADATMSPTTSGGTTCKVWETDSNISFTCADGDTVSFKFTMECVGDDDGIFCCYDYEGTITWTNACCDPADNNAVTRAAVTCDCDPPSFRFGPYRLWRTDPEDTCCRCCEEFYIQVTEAPA